MSFLPAGVTKRSTVKGVLLGDRKREVGEEEVTLSKSTRPAIFVAVWAGSVSFGSALG